MLNSSYLFREMVHHVIFASLFFALIMAYSLYFLFLENNLVENNIAIVIVQPQDVFSKADDSKVAKVFAPLEEVSSKIEKTNIIKNIVAHEESSIKI